MNAKLVPTTQPPPSARAKAMAAILGAFAGAIVAVIGWLVTGESRWFYAIPICALIGIWLGDHRPYVLWGRRAS